MNLIKDAHMHIALLSGEEKSKKIITNQSFVKIGRKIKPFKINLGALTDLLVLMFTLKMYKIFIHFRNSTTTL